jgi:hypothetical protein
MINTNVPMKNEKATKMKSRQILMKTSNEK